MLKKTKPDYDKNQKIRKKIVMGVQQLLSENMKRVRAEISMTQAVLAEKIGSSTSYIAEIETMKKYPSPGKLEDIANALNVEPYELLMPVGKMLKSEDKRHFATVLTDKLKESIEQIEKEFLSD